jgi:hypothetical protein
MGCVLIVQNDQNLRNQCINVFSKAAFQVNTALDSKQSIQQCGHVKTIVMTANDDMRHNPLIELADLTFVKPVSVIEIGERPNA